MAPVTAVTMRPDRMTTLELIRSMFSPKSSLSDGIPTEYQNRNHSPNWTTSAKIQARRRPRTCATQLIRNAMTAKPTMAPVCPGCSGTHSVTQVSIDAAEPLQELPELGAEVDGRDQGADQEKTTDDGLEKPTRAAFGLSDH